MRIHWRAVNFNCPKLTRFAISSTSSGVAAFGGLPTGKPPRNDIGGRILTIRGQRVLLDSDLAAVYGVPTHRLNEAVKRNLSRFPPDFSFVLAKQDIADLISQIAISKTGRGGRRNLPRVLTEHGAMMAATLLNSPRAVEMSVYVVRAFIEMRAVLTSSVQLARKLDALEKTVVVLDADSRRQFKELRALVFPLAMPPDKEQ